MHAQRIEEMDDNKHNVKARLMPKFQNHWLLRDDAFQLLEMCLQPLASKRISVKQALEDMPFLGESSPVSSVS